MTDPARRPDDQAWALRRFCAGFCGAVHGHHATEDRVLFPMLLRRSGADGALGGVIDRLRAEHRTLTAHLDQVERALDDLPGDAAARATAAGAMARLSDLLEAHLRFEEERLARRSTPCPATCPRRRSRRLPGRRPPARPALDHGGDANPGHRGRPRAHRPDHGPGGADRPANRRARWLACHLRVRRRPRGGAAAPALPVQDAVLALLVTWFQLLGTVRAAANQPPARPLAEPGDLGYLLLAAAGVALLARRRWPGGVFVATAGLSLAYYAAGWVLFRLAATVAAAALGASVRSRRLLAVEALERAERAEQTREQEARRRVDAERLRIAREVHDTLAHVIAVINVQAGVAAHVLDKRPQQAHDTLVTIEQTSARALEELRTTLGMLRDPDQDRPTPHPGWPTWRSWPPWPARPAWTSRSRWPPRRPSCPRRSTRPPTGSCRRR
jgi:Histidine kinase/Hemerythrin HHE cation binding domain